MTTLMAAIVGHLLDIRFVDPAIAEIAVTSDGFVLARAAGDTSANFVGDYSDLIPELVRSAGCRRNDDG